MKRSIFLTALLAAAPAAAEPEQTPCGDAMVAIRILAEQFDEHPVMLGDIHDARGQIIIFANRDAGSWTAVIFRNGTACFLASGDGAQVIEPDAQGEPT